LLSRRVQTFSFGLLLVYWPIFPRVVTDYSFFSVDFQERSPPSMFSFPSTPSPVSFTSIVLSLVDRFHHWDQFFSPGFSPMTSPFPWFLQPPFFFHERCGNLFFTKFRVSLLIDVSVNPSPPPRKKFLSRGLSFSTLPKIFPPFFSPYVPMPIFYWGPFSFPPVGWSLCSLPYTLQYIFFILPFPPGRPQVLFFFLILCFVVERAFPSAFSPP